MTSETLPPAANTANGSSIPSKEVPSAPSSRRLEPLEVGWQFVQEYYTILNKDPNRLHCFYNKNSVMVHGTEGETVKTCQGQQEIHKRFKDLDLQDSKVVISNVDSMGTLSNGIIVSVLGEMETKSCPARKFSQSFVLAEQPNGYYVLNDIFRFLKDQFEGVEVMQSPSKKNDAVEMPSPKKEETVPRVVEEPTKVEQPKPVPVSVVETKKPAVTSTPVPPTQPKEQAQKAEEESVISTPPTATTVVEKSATPVVVDVPAQAPAAPAQPKTWAKLAETDKERWAKHVSDTKGQTVAPSTAALVKPPRKSAEAPAKEQKQKHEVSELSVFIKGFSKATKIPHIKDAFAQVVGLVKWVELLTENSAYVEFADAESVKKALDLKTLSVNGEQVLIDDKRTNPQVIRKNRKTQSKNGGNGGPQMQQSQSQKAPSSKEKVVKK